MRIVQFQKLNIVPLYLKIKKIFKKVIIKFLNSIIKRIEKIGIGN